MQPPTYVQSYSLSWAAPNTDWRQEQVLLPKQEKGESLKVYCERCVSYLRHTHNLPPNATIILQEP
jgi:hypothetical protein